MYLTFSDSGPGGRRGASLGLSLSLWRWVPAIALLLLANWAGAQTLINGGFESGLRGWHAQSSSKGSATFSNSVAHHDGTNALLVTVNSAGTKSNSVQLVSQAFKASSSNTYVLRFWMNSSALRARLGVNLLGAKPVFPQIPFQISTNPVGSYQEYVYAFRAAGKVSIAFNFQTPAQYWLDDVEVLDLNNNAGWDIPMTYLWQWGQLPSANMNPPIGWTGGDNNKSALLPDGSVAWVSNDTLASRLNSFYSNIRGQSSLPRNSVVHQVGTNLYWLNQGDATFFVPTNPAHIYWIGDCAVEGDKLLVLLNELNRNDRLRNVCMAVATLSLPALTLDGITRLVSPGPDNFGSFVRGEDDYYYIYNNAKVARAPVGRLADSSGWSFWNGHAWGTNHSQSVSLPNLGNAWSTIRLGPGNYVTLISSAGVAIRAQFAPSPMGPWGPKVLLYNAPAQWGELSCYAPNICAGTGRNGVYTITYSNDHTPEGMNKWASDKSYYDPHYIRVNLLQLSPYSGSNGVSGSRVDARPTAPSDRPR